MLSRIAFAGRAAAPALLLALIATAAAARTGDAAPGGGGAAAAAAPVAAAGGPLLPSLLPEADAAAWRGWMHLDTALAPLLRQRGLAAYDNNEFHTAARLLWFAFQFAPDDLELAGWVGFASKESGRYERAVAVLSRTAGVRASDWQLYWWLGDALRMLGRYDEALLNMLTARDLAPTQNAQEMQQFVEFTEGLVSKEKSWANFDRHVQLAMRHDPLRRTRRCIAEYLAAAGQAPDASDANNKRPLRLGLAYVNAGTQYTFLKEPDVALDYLMRAQALFVEGGEQEIQMRNYQNLAVAYRMLALQEESNRERWLEPAAAAWEEALKLARERNDAEYIRFAQGSLLRELAGRLPLDDARVAELREANLKELPFRGPINDYSMAAVVLGELACRIKDRDFAGARVVIEMAAPYYENTRFLVDSEEAARMQTMLAQAYHFQGHYKQAEDAAVRGAQRVAAVRGFVDSDAFNRSDNGKTMRWAATAAVRAAAAGPGGDKALEYFEQYRALVQQDALGSKVRDEAMLTDIATETALVRGRIAELEAALAAPGAGAAERLEERLERDRMRMTWLERGVRLPDPERLAYLPTPALAPEDLRAKLPEGVALVGYLFDAFGGVALVADARGVRTVALDGATDEALYNAVGALREALERGPAAAKPLLEQLHALLVAPVLPGLEAATLLVVPDEVLNYVPFEALEAGGRALIDDFTVAYVPSGSHAAHALRGDPAIAPSLRAIVRDEDRAAALAPLAAPFAAPESFAGAEATESRALEAAGYGVLHIACKADFAPADAMLTALELAPSPPNDGFLHAAEWLGVTSGARLAVLDLEFVLDPAGVRGTDLSALTEGLWHAGVPAFLVNLWSPPADETGALMGAFYQRLAARGRAAALRDAKLEVRAKFPGSYGWAAYTLRGDYR